MEGKHKPTGEIKMSKIFASNTYTMTDYIEINGVDFECEIEYSYIPGDPGKLYGPPEDCYPPEAPEIEIDVLKITNGKIYGEKNEKIWHHVDFLLNVNEFYDTIESLIWEHLEKEAESSIDVDVEPYW